LIDICEKYARSEESIESSTVGEGEEEEGEGEEGEEKEENTASIAQGEMSSVAVKGKKEKRQLLHHRRKRRRGVGLLLSI
jgi:hypothetical protein